MPQTICCGGAGAGGAHGLHGAGLDGFHRLAEELAQDPAGIDRQGHDAGEGAKTHGDHEDRADDQIGDGSENIQDPPRRLLQPDRRDVPRAGEAQGQGDDDGEGGAPERHLHREPHVGDIGAPGGEVGPQEFSAVLAHIGRAGEEIAEPADLGADGIRRSEARPGRPTPGCRRPARPGAAGAAGGSAGRPRSRRLTAPPPAPGCAPRGRRAGR